MLSKTEYDSIMKVLAENEEHTKLASMHITNAFRGNDERWHHSNMSAMASRLADHYHEQGKHKLADAYRNLATLHETSTD